MSQGHVSRQVPNDLNSVLRVVVVCMLRPLGSDRAFYLANFADDHVTV